VGNRQIIRIRPPPPVQPAPSAEPPPAIPRHAKHYRNRLTTDVSTEFAE